MSPTSRLFFERESERGREKSFLLRESRVVCCRWQDTEPPYRTSWEQLQELMDQLRCWKRKQLALVPHRGLRLVGEFEAHSSVSPLEVFVDSHAKLIFPQLLGIEADEVPFDVDMFMIVDDEFDPRVVIEVFPREKPHIQVTAFGSKLSYEAPLVSPEATTFEEHTHALASLVAAERLLAGESRLAVGHRWILHRGLWEISDLPVASRFLDWCAFSSIEAMTDGGALMVQASVDLDLDGTVIDGNVRLTRSPRKR